MPGSMRGCWQVISGWIGGMCLLWEYISENEANRAGVTVLIFANHVDGVNQGGLAVTVFVLANRFVGLN